MIQGKQKALKEKCVPLHYVHHKTHLDWPRIELGLPLLHEGKFCIQQGTKTKKCVSPLGLFSWGVQ
jgi:hypothetical protein